MHLMNLTLPHSMFIQENYLPEWCKWKMRNSPSCEILDTTNCFTKVKFYRKGYTYMVLCQTSYNDSVVTTYSSSSDNVTYLNMTERKKNKTSSLQQNFFIFNNRLFELIFLSHHSIYTKSHTYCDKTIIKTVPMHLPMKMGLI